MGIAELFIKRPVMTTLVMMALLLFGVMGYRSLPVSDLPNVDFPTIQVSASLPGANPDTMAASVALPLEKQFSTIAGLEQMTSTNTLGSSNITLQFALSRNLDGAAQDVQSMITKAARDLPPNLPTPPSFQKVNPADSPILFLALSSPTMRLSDVDEYAETLLGERISMVSGVAQVSVFGAQKYAVHVRLDPRALAAHQIGIDEVAAAVQNGNVNLPLGTLWGEHQAFLLQTPNGQLYNAAQYRPLIVAYRNGAPVRLRDVGDVFDSVQNDKSAGWFCASDHKLARSMILAIQRQPGTNTVEVVDNIRALLPGLRKQMPAAVNLDTIYDRSQSIRESVGDVKFTLYLSLALVVMVIFLFLRNVYATLIPSLALPFSIIATFAIMYELGYSLDNLSLMALTLSVGFVVDDAIVMLENIVRHMEMGEGPMEASLRGSREIGFTIVSMTLSLAAVFLPVLFMGGIVGRLLHEFAVTIGVAVLVSGFVSLSLTPMLCSRILRPVAEVHHGRLYLLLERFFDGLLHTYARTLKAVMRHRLATMTVMALLLVATYLVYRSVPTGFLASEDQGQLMAMTEATQGTSYDEMVRLQLQVTHLLLDSPEAKYIDSLLVMVPRGTNNQGMIVTKFTARANRPHVDEIARRLRPRLSGIPGMAVYLQNPPLIRIGGQLTKSLYQYTLQSPDSQELYTAVPKLEAALQKSPLLQDVTSDLQLKNPQANVEIDRDKASTLGVTASQVETALSTAYSSGQFSTIYATNNSYWVIMEVLPQYQRDPSALSMLYVRSTNGQLVPLNTVAKMTQGFGPMSVNHLGQLPAVTISFNLRPGVALGDAVAEVERLSGQVLPDTVNTSFQGTAQAFESSFRGLGLLLVMAIAVIYIVLGILYESFIHPITILSGLPSAGLGALLTLKLFHLELNLYSFVGIIMLVGIVKKNAIMMIDFALEVQRKEGKSAADAMYQGALVRFRPIMMTSMAALMGTLPIALGLGAGAEARQPLGLAVVGGLVVSQLLTLYLTPVFFTYMDGLQNLFRKSPKALPVAAEAAALETALR
jgi:HAE1 family hydrophobic/amphiphilic exporter-1